MAVTWEPRPGVSLAADPVHLRLAGSAVALAIAVSEAAVASFVFHLDALWAGVASVTLLGWWLGPGVVRTPKLAGVRMAVLSVILSALLVSGAVAMAYPPTDTYLVIGEVPAMALIGVLLFGLPAFALTGLSSVAWVIGVRWLANHRGSRA